MSAMLTTNAGVGDGKKQEKQDIESIYVLLGVRKGKNLLLRTGYSFLK